MPIKDKHRASSVAYMYFVTSQHILQSFLNPSEKHHLGRDCKENDNFLLGATNSGSTERMKTLHIFYTEILIILAIKQYTICCSFSSGVWI